MSVLSVREMHVFVLHLSCIPLAAEARPDTRCDLFFFNVPGRVHPGSASKRRLKRHCAGRAFPLGRSRSLSHTNGSHPQGHPCLPGEEHKSHPVAAGWQLPGAKARGARPRLARKVCCSVRGDAAPVRPRSPEPIRIGSAPGDSGPRSGSGRRTGSLGQEAIRSFTRHQPRFGMGFYSPSRHSGTSTKASRGRCVPGWGGALSPVARETHLKVLKERGVASWVRIREVSGS